MEREPVHPHRAERWFIRNRNDRYLPVLFCYCGASPPAGIEAREPLTLRRTKRLALYSEESTSSFKGRTSAVAFHWRGTEFAFATGN
jgi:hypothetical protein